MRSLIVLTILVKYSISCAATGGGTVTTTTLPTTTTTSNCQSCTASQVTLTPASTTGGVNNIPATSSDPGPNAAGCKQLNVICAGPPGSIAFMKFNIGEGGPEENNGMTSTVTALLVCTNGEWVYKNERVVTEVNCAAA